MIISHNLIGIEDCELDIFMVFFKIPCPYDFPIGGWGKWGKLMLDFTPSPFYEEISFLANKLGWVLSLFMPFYLANIF